MIFFIEFLEKINFLYSVFRFICISKMSSIPNPRIAKSKQFKEAMINFQDSTLLGSLLDEHLNVDNDPNFDSVDSNIDIKKDGKLTSKILEFQDRLKTYLKSVELLEIEKFMSILDDNEFDAVYNTVITKSYLQKKRFKELRSETIQKLSGLIFNGDIIIDIIISWLDNKPSPIVDYNDEYKQQYILDFKPEGKSIKELHIYTSLIILQKEIKLYHDCHDMTECENIIEKINGEITKLIFSFDYETLDRFNNHINIDSIMTDR